MTEPEESELTCTPEYESDTVDATDTVLDPNALDGRTTVHTPYGADDVNNVQLPLVVPT